MIISALLLSLLACLGAPCQQYVSAVEDCYETLGEPDRAPVDSRYCSDFDATSDDYFTCLAQAYEDGDCSTSDGVSEIDAAIIACTL